MDAATSKGPIERYVESYIALDKQLLLDLSGVSEQLVNADTPLMRRIYIRFLCTTIEGETSARMQIALAMHDLREVKLSNRDVAILRNKRSFYDNGMRKKIDQRIYSIKQNITFSFGVFARAFGSKYNVDYAMILRIENGELLNFLDKTINCRNRLTHPKQVSDLKVDETDIRHATIVDTWYRQSSEELVTSILHS